MANLPLTGGCLCGRVRFELDEAPTRAGYCHCTRCQGRTGSGSSPQAHADDPSQMPDDALERYEGSPPRF